MKTQDKKITEASPGGELEAILREAVQSVETALSLEDQGWINLSGTTADVIDPNARIMNLKLSRLYSVKDPMGKQAIRLWTDYTFGTGLTWSVDDDNKDTKRILTEFWNGKHNQPVLSARGQRKSCDKGLIDGEVFFAIFLGAKGEATIRTVDPLEITEIITDPDDKESEMYYKRMWSDTQGKVQTGYYRSTTNIKGEPAKGIGGTEVVFTQEALIYHLAFNTITQRGNPLLLPALDWLRQYRRFLASRVAIMLALARFAWRSKVKGGTQAVSNIKGKLDAKTPDAGSVLVENLGVDTTPIKTESGAKAAYEDGRQLKLQVAAAVGIPEQYFGDISSGNLATAKTVELPMKKMFESHQRVWADTYKDINEVVLESAGIKPDKWYVDMDFPVIAPEDMAAAAQAFAQILTVMPQIANSDDVIQQALMSLGINDPAQVLDDIKKAGEMAAQAEESNPNVRLIKALKTFRESQRKEE